MQLTLFEAEDLEPIEQSFSLHAAAAQVAFTVNNFQLGLVQSGADLAQFGVGGSQFFASYNFV